MDPRKQKRLGPAPIASFEKSFEDNNSAAVAGNVLLYSSVTHEETEVKDIHRNGIDMESPINITSATSSISSSSNSKVFLQQTPLQQQKPFISVTQTANLANSTKIQKVDSTSGTKRRPPPLKATTTGGGAAARATTTLISSSEQGTAFRGTAFRGTATLTAPSTPRIELSRASSSSHHEEDSRDSSPENVFEQVGTGTLQETIGVGFREEGALELRSSTEELYFMDPEQQREHDKRMQQHQQAMQQQKQQQQTSQSAKRTSPLMFKFDEHQSYLQQHQRKDSASSEVAALLCISGRTSRISSVGSQGSAMSRLSAVSGVSRSPSPHRMLLETSFCGPKPLENPVEGHLANAVEPAAAEMLEQVLLARKSDPTQVVLAEGIRVESSPKRGKPRANSNVDSKIAAQIATALQDRPSTVATAKPVMGRQRQSTKSPGQMVIGKTASGTEYIRINLKPDHMYNDQGVASNERVVEAPDSLTPVTARSSTQKKPISLSLGRGAHDENRLTPTASPKPSRRSTLAKDQQSSRSPSPANVSVSRKSSFSSLFRVGGKDSPDSPRERPRSKSKDRQTPQSLSATPSKQKSVLAIFKPNKRGSNAGADGKSSKTSSPVDRHDQHQQQSKSNTPLGSATGSRPPSRLRYYDEPVEGCIHIPLHTPPEEKETRKLLQGIAQLNAEPMRPIAAPVTASQLVAAAAALKPVGARKGSGPALVGPKPQQIGKVQRIENLDAIHMLPVQDLDNKERNWSLEVQRHSSSQESQETVASDASGGSVFKNNARSLASFLTKHPAQAPKGSVAAAAEIHRLPREENKAAMGTGELRTVALVNSNAHHSNIVEEALAKEKRRLLFATRIGSGSEEQIFSTQFSISKTESQSSQLSEHAPNVGADHLQRMDTILKRLEGTAAKEIITNNKRPLKRFGSVESSTGRAKSLSTSEDEKTPQQTTVSAVVLRHKESQEESRRKSRSTSEDDVDGGASSSMTNQRHSRYLENFDVRRKYNENAPRKPKRQSVSDAGKAESVQLEEAAEPARTEQRKPILPLPPPPSTAPSPSPPPTVPQSATGSRSSTPTKVKREQSQSPIEKLQSRQIPTKSPQASLKASPQPDRQSVHSTDEPIESSESERDSELAAGSSVVAAIDPKRRHVPRHVGTVEDHESTGLVSQESFEDELPYVPTTLPEERAQGVALIPMKERANMELKTCPVDRPRSTTPLNPSHLEEYCGIVASTPPEPPFVANGTPLVRGEKLRISLPRKDAAKEKPQNTKSPRRASNTSGKSWFEFAEEGLRATGATLERKDSNKQLLQQKTAQEVSTVAVSKEKTVTTTTRKLSGHWIDFENIPEKRKPAKRITTLPKDGGLTAAAGLANATTRNHQVTSADPPLSRYVQQSASPDVTTTDDKTLHYNYVKPEDCQCECHEMERETASAEGGVANKTSLTTVDLLQQGEDMLPLLDPDIHDSIEPSDSSRELSCYTDDEADGPTRQGSLRRYRINAMKTDEFPRRDGSRSPRNRKFPDHRYS